MSLKRCLIKNRKTMKKIIFVISILLLLSSPLGAQETKHSQLAIQFADVMGLDKMLQNSKLQAEHSAQQQFSQIMDQLKKSSPNMPDQYLKDLQEAGAEFVSKISLAWDSAEAARVYTSTLAENLPEDELRKSIEHYQTPQGQNELKAINEAAAKLNAYILSSSQEACQAATNEFLYKLRLSAEKAKREREARSN